MTKETPTSIPLFHYWTKNEVRKGDIVTTGNDKTGIVVLVIAPRSADAEAFDCWDEGGILIEEDWDGTPSLILESPPDGIFWEDLNFIRRSNKIGRRPI